MEIIFETFEELERLGLATSQNQFSTDWLGKSKRYYSMIKASGREPSIAALCALASNLKLRHDTYSSSALPILNEKADALYPVTKRVWERLLTESVQ